MFGLFQFVAQPNYLSSWRPPFRHGHHIGLITMMINKLLVRQINIHGVGRYNISSLTELFYFSALGKAVRLGRGAVQDDEWCTSCTGAPHDGAPHVNVVRVENTRR